MRIRKNQEKFIIIPELLSLNTNVDRIPHFPLGPFMYKLPGGKTKLDFSFIVKKNIKKPLELNIKFGYFWGAYNNKRIYYEHPFFGGIKLKMLVERKNNDFIFFVDHFYYKYITFILERVWPSGLYLQNVVTLSLSSIGFVALHGACISKKDQGVLIFASSRMGKSLTTFSSLKKGYKILSEDYLILNSKNVYGTPLMSSYFLRYHSTKKNWWKEKFYKLLSTFPFLTIILSHIIPLSLFVPFKSFRAFLDKGNLKRKAKIGKICILEKGKTGIEKLSPEKALKKMLALNRANSFYYNDSFLRALSYFNPEINIETISDTEEKNLSSIVSQSECYLLRADDSAEYINLLAKI